MALRSAKKSIRRYSTHTRNTCQKSRHRRATRLKASTKCYTLSSTTRPSRTEATMRRWNNIPGNLLQCSIQIGVGRLQGRDGPKNQSANASRSTKSSWRKSTIRVREEKATSRCRKWVRWYLLKRRSTSTALLTSNALGKRWNQLWIKSLWNWRRRRNSASSSTTTTSRNRCLGRRPLNRRTRTRRLWGASLRAWARRLKSLRRRSSRPEVARAMPFRAQGPFQSRGQFSSPAV